MVLINTLLVGKERTIQRRFFGNIEKWMGMVNKISSWGSKLDSPLGREYSDFSRVLSRREG
jgi:hypothetical protein